MGEAEACFAASFKNIADASGADSLAVEPTTSAELITDRCDVDEIYNISCTSNAYIPAS